jgi:hypothetical protein
MLQLSILYTTRRCGMSNVLNSLDAWRLWCETSGSATKKEKEAKAQWGVRYPKSTGDSCAWEITYMKHL